MLDVNGLGPQVIQPQRFFQPSSSILPEICYPWAPEAGVLEVVPNTLSDNALTTEPSPVTAPLPPVLPPAEPVAPPPYQAPTGPVRFPLGWLLQNASAPIQYRATTEVARLFDTVPRPVANLPFTYRPGLLLAATQKADSTWGARMLSVPTGTGIEGIGTIVAVRRLLEAGWDRESPPLLRARRLLFRLLAEDEDPSYLFELREEAGDDELRIRLGRRMLREAAAAVLAQAGYESDPRLRGAARRIVERIADYLKSPAAQKPWMRVGNKHVLVPEAAPPSFFALVMLAHMPLFRSEHHDAMERLYQHLSQPLPRQEPVQLIGEAMVARPHLVLGDHVHSRQAVEADLGYGIVWLELMARLGFLRRNEGWSTLFERMLEHRDHDGVWRAGKGDTIAPSKDPVVWPAFPLQERLEGEGRHVDVTFRLGLIARLSGRPIEPV